MAQITRLGVSGITRHTYATFTAKTFAWGPFTRLGVSGFPRFRYADGAFAGKASAAGGGLFLPLLGVGR